MAKKIFRKFKISSIQKDDASMSGFLNAFKDYNLTLKRSFVANSLRHKFKYKNWHRPSYYTYIILSGYELEKVMDLLSKNGENEQGIYKKHLCLNYLKLGLVINDGLFTREFL